MDPQEQAADLPPKQSLEPGLPRPPMRNRPAPPSGAVLSKNVPVLNSDEGPRKKNPKMYLHWMSFVYTRLIPPLSSRFPKLTRKNSLRGLLCSLPLSSNHRGETLSGWFLPGISPDSRNTSRSALPRRGGFAFVDKSGRGGKTKKNDKCIYIGHAWCIIHPHTPHLIRFPQAENRNSPRGSLQLHPPPRIIAVAAGSPFSVGSSWVSPRFPKSKPLRPPRRSGFVFAPPGKFEAESRWHLADPTSDWQSCPQPTARTPVLRPPGRRFLRSPTSSSGTARGGSSWRQSFRPSAPHGAR